MHWFNAVCWFWLLFTGLGLIKNPELQPISWWPVFMRDLFGSGENLLVAHWAVGFGWVAVWAAFIIARLKDLVIPFIVDLHRVDLKRDIPWMIKKNLQMLVGYKNMAAMVKPLGWDATIPDQGYYNVGQKAAALPIIGGGVLLAVTGAIMYLSMVAFTSETLWLVQWSITIHYIMAVLTTAVLLIHIFVAGVSREERPALKSMFTGYVPQDYAQHHHKIWYDQVQNQS
jgi:formate dehydrogenase subunit gamma